MQDALRSASPHSSRITVLLVDDQRFVGAALSRLLSAEADFELHCCYDAVDAIAQAHAIEPTIILQDLVMPGMDGITLVGLYRSNAVTASTPVIVLSGNDDADARQRALDAGATDYLVKLPSRDQLIACLRRHAAGQRDQEPSLDPRVMDAFRQAMPADASAFTLNLIDQFIQEAASLVGTLQDAARRHDAAALKATAHSLKGSAMIMGARRLAALCSRVEDHLKHHPGAAVAAALMCALDGELVQVRNAFVLQRRNICQSVSHDAGITGS